MEAPDSENCLFYFWVSILIFVAADMILIHQLDALKHSCNNTKLKQRV